jgi:hypothetical protein
VAGLGIFAAGTVVVKTVTALTGVTAPANPFEKIPPP